MNIESIEQLRREHSRMRRALEAIREFTVAEPAHWQVAAIRYLAINGLPRNKKSTMALGDGSSEVAAGLEPPGDDDEPPDGPDYNEDIERDATPKGDLR